MADHVGYWSSNCVGGLYATVDAAEAACLSLLGPQASGGGLMPDLMNVSEHEDLYVGGSFAGTVWFTCVEGSCAPADPSSPNGLLTMEDAAVWGFAFGSLILTAWAFKMLIRALGSGDMRGSAAYQEEE